MIRKQIHQQEKLLLLFKQNFKCKYCKNKVIFQSKVHKTIPEIDHIIPLNFGGDDNISNKQILCYSCHRIKTTKEIRIKNALPIISQISKNAPNLLYRLENTGYYGMSINDMRKFLKDWGVM